MNTDKTFTVVAERSGRWWNITFPDVEFVYAQARQLNDVETAARSALAAKLEVEPDRIRIMVDVRR